MKRALQKCSFHVVSIIENLESMPKEEFLDRIANLVPNNVEFEYLCSKYEGKRLSKEEFCKMLRILKDNDMFSSFRRIVKDYHRSCE